MGGGYYAGRESFFAGRGNGAWEVSGLLARGDLWGKCGLVPCLFVRLLGMAYVETRKKARAFARGDLLAVSSTKLSKDSTKTTIAEAKGMRLEDAGWRDGPCGRLQRHAECAATEKDYGGRAEGCQETCALDIVFGQGRRLRK